MSKDYDYYLEPERLAKHCAILQPLYLDLVLVIYAGESMAPYRDTIKNMVRYLYGEILKNAWW